MEPLRTERLVLRQLRLSDLAAFHAYRNDETTAEFQSWTVPYPLEKAEQVVGELAAMDGPADDTWFSYGIADPVTDQLLGDISVRLEWNGRAAEIGFTLAPDSRGKGIAFEAANRVIEHLLNDLGVQRLHASLHPDNYDSMSLLERLGMIYEGTSRQAYWVGDNCTDDPHFGMLRSDWESWHTRPRHRPEAVELVEVTHANRDDVFHLETHHSQRQFVSPMSKSAADALVPDRDDNGGISVPWFRAIVADGQIVGFVMVAEPTETNPKPYLWRLLIDRIHQRRSIGWRVLDLIAARYRTAGHERLDVSWHPSKGGPEPMYLRYGFVPTGEMYDDEIVATLALSSPNLGPQLR
jgi:RimJ/RimL family protein N-acetyltransferase